MSDRKLRQVALASFNYRHEAEFAAGFLRDAGIPFLLQIEDPALGLSATNSATIFVTAMDESRARRVLEHDVIVDEEGDDVWAEEVGEERDAAVEPVSVRPTGTSRAPDGREQSGAIAPHQGSADLIKTQSDLTLRSRVVALVGGAGVASAALLDAVRQNPLLWWGVALVAVLLAIAGLFGRAPGPLRGILEALSGDAP
ncbi:MAG: hypothetical protein HKN72_16435 [Gemmatimonadetes bacterium]|nr:hypothetical protein [Gemmatimonadota bacterium]